MYTLSSYIHISILKFKDLATDKVNQLFEMWIIFSTLAIRIYIKLNLKPTKNICKPNWGKVNARWKILGTDLITADELKAARRQPLPL